MPRDKIVETRLTGQCAHYAPGNPALANRPATSIAAPTEL